MYYMCGTIGHGPCVKENVTCAYQNKRDYVVANVKGTTRQPE